MKFCQRVAFYTLWLILRGGLYTCGDPYSELVLTQGYLNFNVEPELTYSLLIDDVLIECIIYFIDIPSIKHNNTKRKMSRCYIMSMFHF
jgi:hypothetical protein